MIDVLILVLGTYRLWMLAANDILTEPLRERLLGYSRGADGKYHRNRWPHARKGLGEFIHCPWCLGFWLSLIVLAAYQADHDWTRIMLAPFALSAAVALCAVCFDRLVLDREPPG